MQRHSRWGVLAVGLFVAISSVSVTRARAVARAKHESSGDYYYNAGRRVPIARSTSRVAVRVDGSASKADALERLAMVSGVRAVRAVSADLVEVSLDGQAESGLAATASQLGGSVYPVFFEPGIERDASTLFVADAVLVRFRANVTPADIASLGQRLGFDVAEPLKYASNAFRIRARSSSPGSNALTVANACFESGMCEWAHPDFLAHRALRFVPDDPQFANQWHLLNTGQGSGVAGADVKAVEAWDITRGSASISVAVADTGIDVHHEDFAVTVGGLPKVHDPRDVVHGDDDPSPSASDADGRHGTSASGVAVAAIDNGLDTAGIAPGCRLVPIQLYAESTFTPNSTEADAFTWAADHADVMSNSWGPDNDDTPLPDATRAAIDYATTNGRGGKGTVIFFAAGNSNDDTVHDNYVSYSGVVAVAASNNFDTRSPYSRFGDAVAVSAPSSGGSLGITTTDVTGAGGYSSLNFTNGFGGTSSACPLAAGIGALVLSENPDLTWSEVKGVLEQSADKIDPVGGAYDGSGRSAFYGFGRVNALAAVELARDLLDPQAPHVTLAPLAGPIPAGGTVSLDWTRTGTLPVVSQTLEYSSDGSTFVPIASPPTAATSYEWAVPDELTGSITVRITIVSSGGASATSALGVSVRARPTIATVKLKTASTGKRSLVVDGTGFVVGEAVIYVGETALGSIKFPKGRLSDDGTASRIVSKDSRLNQLVPRGVAVTVTVRQSGNQSSAEFSFTR